MRHFVFYSNTDQDGEIEWPEEGEIEFGIHTRSPVKSALGGRVWFITGSGTPKEFALSYTFVAEAAEPHEAGSRLSGFDGLYWDPAVRLNEESWFAELRKTQFWSLGLFEIQSEAVVEGLMTLLDEAGADSMPTWEGVLAVQEEEVAAALASTVEERAERLRAAPKIPPQIEVLTTAFVRNPDVIAEVLLRAGGLCEKCGNAAPFIRKSDGTPYLEVHHWTPLAEGGEDTVENAGALCPNCHRQAHYG